MKKRIQQRASVRELHLLVLLMLALFLLPAQLRPAWADSSAEASSEPAESEADSYVIPEEWFDDALFIGDSITGSLQSYTLYNGGLGDAKVIHLNGLSCRKIVADRQELFFMGKKCMPGEAAALAGAKKLFLLLPANDIGAPLDELEASWNTLIDSIEEQSPGTAIYVQLGTPVREDVGYFTKANVDDYNDMLRRVCAERGCVYVTITKGLVKDDGFLDAYYLQDRNDLLHLSQEGCAIWVENLKCSASYSIPPVIDAQHASYTIH